MIVALAWMLAATGVVAAFATARELRRLKKQTLEELAQEQLIADKKMPAKWRTPDGRVEADAIRGPAAPSEMLQTVWYGDQINWGKNRQALQALRADPVWAALWDIEARQSASGFAHFYVGFALLIESVLSVATTA